MSLAEYQEKRDWTRTPEPRGSGGGGAAGGRFVVQEHHARRLHWDLRLEIAGTLKSWAVPKGPSRDPDTRRLAVQVEDHPLEYIDFHGEIPAGTYGAGQVYVWDAGRFETREADALDAWKRGRLHLSLHGDRLRGEWRLFRTSEQDSGQPQWILQKAPDEWSVAGDAAPLIADGAVPAQSTVRRTPEPTLEGSLSPEEFLTWAAPRGSAVLNLAGDRVALTSLDKVYWPREGITKGRLLQYYLGVAPWIGPHLEGCPAILKRYPQGVESAPFYQHQVESAPRFLRIERLLHGGEPTDYAVYGSVATLLHLVNLGNIEQHPWLARAEKPDHPRWLVIDLDPGEKTPWEEVVATALETRAALATLGLESGVKTSGSRGLHVYVPLEPIHSHEEVARVAEAICRFVAERRPRWATPERARQARRPEQIYMDWVQNGRGKSLAAPYSARAVPGARVSTPLAWQDLEGADPATFTFTSVLAALSAAGDPWSGLLARPQRLGRV